MRYDNGYLVFPLKGWLTRTNVEKFKTLLESVAANYYFNLALDFGEVTMVDSSAIEVLLKFNGKFDNFCLFNVRGTSYDIFSILALDKILKIFRTKEQFLSYSELKEERVVKRLNRELQ